AAIQDLHEVIGSAQKRAYLSLTQLRGIFDDTVILAVPDAYTRDVIESQLHTLITEALGRQFGRQIQVAVTIRTPDGHRNALTDPTGAGGVVPIPKPKTTPHVPASRDPSDDSAGAESTGRESGPGRHTSDAARGHVAQHRDERRVGGGDGGNRLNPKYTFETFVIGSSKPVAPPAPGAGPRSPPPAVQPPFYHRRPPAR